MTQSLEITKVSETSPYWDTFENARLESKSPSWVFPLRKAAMSRFAELGFPTTKDEDWRFTNVAAISKLPFKPSLSAATQLEAGAVQRQSFTTIKASRLVFLDGYFSKELSDIIPQTDGIKISNLASALQTDGALIEKHLTRHAQDEVNAFTALNTAFFTDGAFIYVPAGKTVADPVHLLFITTSLETGATANPRNLHHRRGVEQVDGHRELHQHWQRRVFHECRRRTRHRRKLGGGTLQVPG